MTSELSPKVELELSPEEAEQRCMQDLDFLAAICMPEVSSSPYPEFYQAVWQLIISKIAELGPQEVFRFALGLPRGHAKTTFIKLLVVYCVVFSLVDFILIICATEALSKNFLADVNDILKSQMITDIFGSWDQALSTDKAELKKARYRGQDVILACAGAGTAIRGLNIRNRRPQLEIFDDAQTRENERSEAESADLRRWVNGTAIKARDNKKAAILYVGNLYSAKNSCILWQFCSSPYWLSLLTGALLADGTALWPAIRSVESLVDEFNADASVGEGAAWFAEVQNDPIASTISLLPNGIIPPVPEDLPNWETGIASFITIDPAGRHKKSDDNVICPHILLDAETAVVPEFTSGIMNPEQVILATIKYIIKYRISVVFIESVAYQETLIFWMDKYLEHYNLANTVVIVPVNPGRQSKLSRIRVWIKLLILGKWHIIDPVARNKLLFQALAFKVDKATNRDDILDCLAQGAMVMNTHLPTIFNNSNRMCLDVPVEDDTVYQGDSSPLHLIKRRS